MKNQIDWSKSDVKRTAEDLFPLEFVTKAGCMIHAYGYDNVTKYLTTIANSQ